ncbi:MAG TPA: ferric reductase-like transmembrane domain-containing protein [Solirubrobacteraceae bacterium]|nr:ferric reductase-like transmembrane domain-containing protein [Solirubrobacteraceae bacterium]
MKHQEPIHLIWWLVSRASGIVALVLISLSVLMGLAMAARVLGPGIKRAVARLHEHLALVALVAIAVHGLALLGDHWLKPGWRGITVPFALSYRPAFTGLGIIAGYLAVLLGPSFYVRKRLGPRRWRRLHRFTVAVWILSVVHTLGSGSDRSQLWLECIVLAPVVPIVYLLVLRLLPREARGANAKRHGAVAAAQRPVVGGRAGRTHRPHSHGSERPPVAGRHVAEETV